MNPPGRRPRAYALHVSDYSAPYAGSFIRQLRVLDDALRARGYEGCATAFPEGARACQWSADLEKAGLRVHFLPEPSPRWPWRAGAEIKSLIGTLECKVVHSHFGSYDVAALHAARTFRPVERRPCVIWHYRTALEESPSMRPSLRRGKDFVKYRCLGRRVDACVAVTRALREEARARGFRNPVRTVYGGCDSSRFMPDTGARARVRQQLGLAEHDIVVLHLGWHWYRKGGDLLVDAAGRLAGRKTPHLVFLTVGAPVEVDGPVRVLPFTERIDELQQAADIFVSASRSEGFGNGLLEALACGSVAVATSVEGQRELFANLPGCIAVPAGDATALAQALEALLERKLYWGELGAQNRRHVVARYSLQAWSQSMVATYEEIIGSSATDTADPTPVI